MDDTRRLDALEKLGRTEIYSDTQGGFWVDAAKGPCVWGATLREALDKIRESR